VDGRTPTPPALLACALVERLPEESDRHEGQRFSHRDKKVSKKIATLGAAPSAQGVPRASVVLQVNAK
jgi:hypothetical protein